MALLEGRVEAVELVRGPCDKDRPLGGLQAVGYGLVWNGDGNAWEGKSVNWSPAGSSGKRTEEEGCPEEGDQDT